MRIKKLIKRCFILVLIAVFAACAVMIYKGHSLYEKALQRQDVQTLVESIRTRPDYLSLDELPQMYKDAVVAVEDHRFYDHPGFDIIATGRALVNDIKAMSLVEGGSTIPQQLSKNLFFTQDKEFTRKIAEVFMAFKLEEYYTKDELLELYVNTIYFGDGYYGIRAASVGYLGKEPAQMDDFESTLLAGIPNAPSVYALTVNPELAQQRQKQVLRQMEKRGYLTQEESSEILASNN